MNSHILLIIVLCVIAGSTIYGAQRGFLKTIIPIATIILTFWVVSVIMPYFSDYLKKDARQLAFIEVICDILAFGVTCFIMKVIIKLSMKLVEAITAVPVIHGTDRILGIFAGIFFGFLLVWVAFYFMLLVVGRENGAAFFRMVDSDIFLKYLYNHNILMTFINSVAFT